MILIGESVNFLYRCNILICPHFPVHKGGLHEWNTRLCMPSGLCSTSFSIFCAPQEIYRNGASVYFCTSWVSGILCKSECYTGITHSHENTCICLIFLLLKCSRGFDKHIFMYWNSSLLNNLVSWNGMIRS